MKTKRILMGLLGISLMASLASCDLIIPNFPTQRPHGDQETEEGNSKPSVKPETDDKNPTESSSVAKEYTITFYVDGNKYGEPIKVLENGLIMKPIDPVKEGYSFKGWYLNGILFNFNTRVHYDLSLHAEFEEINNNDDIDKTIVFYSTMNNSNREMTNIAINSFEEKFPGWKVKHKTYSSFDKLEDKVMYDLLENKAPDLTYAHSGEVSKYMTTGKVVDLSRFINSNETISGFDGYNPKEFNLGYSLNEVADFNQYLMGEAYANKYKDYENYFNSNSIITLPFYKSTIVMYYNEDVLNNLNLNVPKTLADLAYQASIIKAYYPNCTPIGIDSESDFLMNILVQLGVTDLNALYDLNNPNNQKVIKALEDIKTLYSNGYITTKGILNEYTSSLFKKGEDGGCIYSFATSGGVKHHLSNSFNTGVAVIPGVNNSHIGSTFGMNLVMLDSNNSSNNSIKQKMTFMFMKELLDPVFQAKFNLGTGYIPVRKSTVDIPEYKAFFDCNLIGKTAKIVTDSSMEYYSQPTYPWFADFKEEINKQISYMLIGLKTPEEALRDAVENGVN